MSEASILSSLNLGTSRNILENKQDSPLGSLMQDLCNDVVKQLQEALVARDVNTSSLALSQSIHTNEVTLDGDMLSVGISMNFYWKFINYGVNGTEMNWGAPSWGQQPSQSLSFKDSILEWIPQRGVALPDGFQSFDQLAYAIMTNIRKRGQEPRPFFNDVVNPALIEVMAEPIANVVGRAIQISIAEPFR